MNARGLLVPLLVLLLLIAAAGATLGVLSAREGGSSTQEPSHQRLRRRLAPDLTPIRPRLTQRGYIGVVVSEANGTVKIESVTPGGPAGDAGLRGGDAIENVGGQAVHSVADITAAVAGTRPGDTVTVRVLRGAASQDIRVRAGRRPIVAPQERTPSFPRGNSLPFS